MSESIPMPILKRGVHFVDPTNNQSLDQSLPWDHTLPLDQPWTHTLPLNQSWTHTLPWSSNQYSEIINQFSKQIGELSEEEFKSISSNLQRFKPKSKPTVWTKLRLTNAKKINDIMQTNL